MGRKIAILAVVSMVVLLVATWLFVYHPSGADKLGDRVEKSALMANVLIMQESKWINDGGGNPGQGTSSGTSYGVGASGTIIKRDGNRNYVLTAYHVIKPEEDSVGTDLRVFDFNDKAKMESSDFQKYQGIENFYKRFPKARVESYDKRYDLAVISFVSKENYATIQIAKSLPKFGHIVESLSNPNETRNRISVGRVLSSYSTPSSMRFYGVKYPLLTHSAYGSEGSSGGMVLDENLQLIGVTLGGTEIKFFGIKFFMVGKAMPCTRIHDFLKENGFEEKSNSK